MAGAREAATAPQPPSVRARIHRKIKRSRTCVGTGSATLSQEEGAATLLFTQGMASRRARGTAGESLLRKLQDALERGDFYEALQMYRSVVARHAWRRAPCAACAHSPTLIQGRPIRECDAGGVHAAGGHCHAGALRPGGWPRRAPARMPRVTHLLPPLQHACALDLASMLLNLYEKHSVEPTEEALSTRPLPYWTTLTLTHACANSLHSERRCSQVQQVGVACRCAAIRARVRARACMFATFQPLTASRLALLARQLGC